MLAVLGVRVRFWLFYGLAACFSVVCLFYAAACALCAWFRWFPSFIYHFIVVWRLPALRLLCAAVSALCPVVFDGVLFVQHFCVNWCFLCCFPTFVWFSTFFCVWFRFLCRCFSHCLVTFVCFFFANFSSLLMSVFIFFSVVECCFLAIFVFTFPHYKSKFLGLTVCFKVICLSLPLFAHFLCF